MWRVHSIVTDPFVSGKADGRSTLGNDCWDVCYQIYEDGRNPTTPPEREHGESPEERVSGTMVAQEACNQAVRALLGLTNG